MNETCEICLVDDDIAYREACPTSRMRILCILSYKRIETSSNP